MDQAVVAGIGNVYRAEILYRHRVDPYLPGRLLDESRWHPLWTDLVTLMRAGLRSGRIVTTEPADRDRRSRPGPARGRPLRVPPRRPAVPDLRHAGADAGARRPQALLVPDLPVGVSARTSRRSGGDAGIRRSDGGRRPLRAVTGVATLGR